MLQAGKIDFLIFYASWSELSLKFVDKIKKIEKEFNKINFFYLDIDQVENSEIIKTFSISEIPTSLIISDSQLLETIAGYNLIKPVRTILRKVSK